MSSSDQEKSSRESILAKREVIFCVVFPLLYFVLRTYLGMVRFPLLVDDAYITLRYVQNFLVSGDLLYNPGEFIYGITTVLFPLLLIVLGTVTGSTDLVTITHVLNFVFEIGCYVVLVQLFLTQGLRLAAASCLSIMLVSTGLLLTASQGGMETPLFCMCLMLSGTTASRDIRVASAFAGMALFVRPEGILAIGIVALLSLKSQHFKTVWAMSALFGLSYAAFLYVGYGSVVPASVAVKKALPPPEYRFLASTQVFISPISFIPTSKIPYILSLLIVYGVVAYGVATWPRKTKSFFFLVTFPILYWLFYTLGNPHMWFWYNTPYGFFVGTFFVFGIYQLVMFLPESKRLPVLVALCLVFTGLSVRIAFKQDGSVLALYMDRVNSYRNGILELEADHGLTKDSSILTHEIGAIGYYSGSKIYDAVGLINPQWASMGLTESEGRTRYGRCTARLVEQCAPDFILIQENLFEEGLTKDTRFTSNYDFLYPLDNSAIDDRTGNLVIYKRKGESNGTPLEN